MTARSFLIRCYPARWRDRYGDEFEAVLAERPLGPFDVADILLGAVDARLRLRGRGTDTQKGTGLSMSLRLGGAAAIVGAVLFPTGLIVTSLNGSDGMYAGAMLILVGTWALLVALIGLSSFQARQHARLIWVAFALPALGTVISSVGIIGMATIGDRPLVAGLSPWSIWILGVIATVLGSGLFALATYYSRALPRPAAGILTAGSGILLAVILVVASGIVPGMDGLAPALTVAGLIAFSIGWIALGVTAIRIDQPAAATA